MASPTVTWQVLADWYLSGDFVGSGDDITSRVDIHRGITLNRGRDPARALGEPRIPTMQFVAFNDDKFFSNDYSLSPIFERARTGVPVQLRYTLGTDVNANSASVDANDVNTLANGTASSTLFTGFLDRITHQLEFNQRRITARVLGSLVRLRDIGVRSSDLYIGITTGEAMGHLLDLAGWSATARRIEGTAVTLAYWWLDREDPFRAAVDLLKTEGPGAALYEDEDGTIVFEGQNYRQITDRSLNVQAEYMPDGTGVYFEDPQHEDGADAIINEAQYNVRERRLDTTTQVVWRYDGTITLTAGEARIFRAYTSDPVTALVSPLVATTDYVLSSGSLNFAEVSQRSANGIQVEIVGGGSGAVVTTLQVRGQPYKVSAENEVTNNIDTTTSQGRYGLKVRNISGRAEIDKNVAAAICDTTVQRYAAARAVNHFGLVGYDEEPLNEIMIRRVSDRVHFREDQSGQDIDSFVEFKELKIVDNIVMGTIGCERTETPTGPGGTGSYGLYDDATYDVGVYGQ